MTRNDLRRPIVAGAMLLTVVSSTTACGVIKRDPTFEVIMEATGTQAKQISYTAPHGPGPEDEGKPQAAELTEQPLPWQRGLVTKGGEVTFTVTPKDGVTTCRIVLEKKEVAKQQGQPGAPVTCHATIAAAGS
jgi:hypothetical protein